MRKFEVISKYKNDEVKLPKRSTQNSAGYDFFCLAHQTLPPFQATMVKTGIKACFPNDEVLLLYNRSSNPIKKNLILLNGVGVIDADYYNNKDNEGEIGFCFYNMSHEYIILEKGDKLGQGVFVNFKTVDNDNASGQREGGFGSTDDKDNNSVQKMMENKQNDTKAYAWISCATDEENGIYAYGTIMKLETGEKFNFYDINAKNSKESKGTRGIIEACKLAIEETKRLEIKNLTIFSKHQGIKGWGEGKWKTNLDYTKEYAEYINSLKDIEIHFVLLDKKTSNPTINEIKTTCCKNLELYNIKQKTPKKIVKAKAWCDGSYNKKTKTYGYGVYLEINDEKYEFSGKGKDKEKAKMHNIAGETDGAIRAVNEAINKGVTNLTLYYDCLGIEKWATQSWKRNNQWTKVYSEFMQEKMKEIDIKFVHVKGHSGDKGNELVDKLAKKAVGNKVR